VSRSVANRVLHSVFSRVNQKRQWYQLPTTSLKALNLLSLRLDLRDLNLFDTGTPSQWRHLGLQRGELVQGGVDDGPDVEEDVIHVELQARRPTCGAFMADCLETARDRPFGVGQRGHPS